MQQQPRVMFGISLSLPPAALCVIAGGYAASHARWTFNRASEPHASLANRKQNNELHKPIPRAFRSCYTCSRSALSPRALFRNRAFPGFVVFRLVRPRSFAKEFITKSRVR